MGKLTHLQTTVLSALCAFIVGDKYSPAEDVDWEALLRESRAQAVSLSVLQGLDMSHADAAVAAAWKQTAFRTLHNNTTVQYQHAYIHELLTKNAIPYCVLKGCASAMYYPEPMMRAMGDVDVLVAPQDIERTRALLVAEGFTVQEDKHACHVVFRKGAVHCEVHFAPPGLPEGHVGDTIRGYLADVLEKATLAEINGNAFMAPSPFHHGLILLMHTYHHMLAEGIGLRHLCDWAWFVRQFEGEHFAEVFRQKLSAVGLWRFAQILSATAHRYLGNPYADWLGESDEALCEAIMCDIFAGGNFGHKDNTRTTQGLMISDRGKDGVSRDRGGQLFRSLNQAAHTRYPVLARLPLLKHMAFVPLGIRYVVRVITGKRPQLGVKGAFAGAEARRKIYEQFALFETEERTT